jgi:hypothetical protein
MAASNLFSGGLLSSTSNDCRKRKRRWSSGDEAARPLY